MMELTPTLRIRDKDAHQYVLEERLPDSEWYPIGYFGTIRALLRTTRLHFASQKIAPVKEAALLEFEQEWEDQVKGLPEKKGPPPEKGKKARAVD